MKLVNIWNQINKKKGSKVRYRDWNHKIKYFVIESYDEKNNKFHGTLDNGEKIEFSGDTEPWKIYEDEDESSARAV